VHQAWASRLGLCGQCAKWKGFPVCQDCRDEEWIRGHPAAGVEWPAELQEAKDAIGRQLKARAAGDREGEGEEAMGDCESDLFDLQKALKRAKRILAEPGRPGSLIVALSLDPLSRRWVNNLGGILQDCARQAAEIAGEPVDVLFGEQAGQPDERAVAEEQEG
jgi:hypothetical protein